ncbi:uncharacterized protein BDZ99DRAFT_411298, partial [Mytilinidion resinicola]
MSSPPKHLEHGFGSDQPLQASNPKSRREVSGTGTQSSRSPSFNEDLLVALTLEERLDIEHDEKPVAKLARMLSVRSIISTTSSFASKMEAARKGGYLGMYRSIGAGTCGIVFEELGTVNAIKLAKTDDSQLWNDYQFHTMVREKIMASPIKSENLQVPKCLWFAKSDDKKWWDLHRHRFPDQSRVERPRDVLCTERILPIPKELRHAIIDAWCPEDLREKAKAEPTNRDCLIRVYLGKRRRDPTTSRPLKMFQLRNYNLHVDQIMELAIEEYGEVAENMGRALAVLHWLVATDARDVEFVLGSAPTPKPVPLAAKDVVGKAPRSTWEEVTSHNFKRRAIRLWLLDFNQCRPISRDDESVKKAVQAFFENDPYYPRPLTKTSTEQRLWTKFKAGYLEAA